MTDVKSLYHNFGAAASVEFLSQGAVFYHSLSDLVLIMASGQRINCFSYELKIGNSARVLSNQGGPAIGVNATR